MKAQVEQIRRAALIAKVRCLMAIQALEGIFTAIDFDPSDEKFLQGLIGSAGDELRFALDDLRRVAPEDKMEEWK